MNKGIISWLAVIFLLSSFLAGCSQTTVTDTTPEEGYVIVTDYLGKEVKVKQNPEYYGSLFAVATHILAMYGEVDQVVTMADGNTKDILFMEIYPQLQNARIVKGNNTLNIEEVVKKPRPEVLIANPEVTLDDVTVEKLEKLGIPTITIAYENIAEQQRIMGMMGTITGNEQEAAAYNQYLQSVVDLVADRTNGIPENEKKTIYHAVNELLRTDIPGTLSEDVFNLAGTKNVALLGEQEDIPITGKHFIALEELMQHNPEYILINGEDVLTYIEQSPQLHNLRAYREGHIYLLPLGVSRWGHPNSIETPLAILWTAKTVYPELFSDVDIEKETRDFYRNFFDYELSDSQLAKILSGKGYKKISPSGGPGI